MPRTTSWFIDSDPREEILDALFPLLAARISPGQLRASLHAAAPLGRGGLGLEGESRSELFDAVDRWAGFAVDRSRLWAPTASLGDLVDAVVAGRRQRSA
ncbi:MAG: hypothetical protein HY791_06405 [Deltaproteobacteria bacterium]|nr:hypothetical protein [Deltaproteobacteria bacterium]